MLTGLRSTDTGQQRPHPGPRGAPQWGGIKGGGRGTTAGSAWNGLEGTWGGVRASDAHAQSPRRTPAAGTGRAELLPTAADCAGPHSREIWTSSAFSSSGARWCHQPAPEVWEASGRAAGVARPGTGRLFWGSEWLGSCSRCRHEITGDR